MAEWLYLRLAEAPGGPVSWLEAGAASTGAVHSGTLAQAGAAASGHLVCVLVPAADVLSTEVDVPVRSSSNRLAQIVPFALEEQLVADLEQQHFAIGRRAADSTRTPVAVVGRDRLEAWLAALREVGIVPEQLYADTSLLPPAEGHAVALLEANVLTVRGSAGGAPLSAPADDLAAALKIALGSEELIATDFSLYLTQAEWNARQSEIEALRSKLASLRVQLLASGPLPWLITQLPTAHPINLLQGSFAPAGAQPQRWQRWRLAASLAAGLLLLYVGAQVLQIIRYHRATARLEQQMQQLAGPAFAGGSGPLRTRIQQRLDGMQSASDPSALLPAMQALALAMGSVPDARLQSLSYHNGALDLKVHAGDAQALERINQALQSAGDQANLMNGNSAGGGYEGSLQVRVRSSS
jgi:general secretion pathway protein L